jgi:hypothetical protein
MTATDLTTADSRVRQPSLPCDTHCTLAAIVQVGLRVRNQADCIREVRPPSSPSDAAAR